MELAQFRDNLLTSQDRIAGKWLIERFSNSIDAFVVLGSGLAEALKDTEVGEYTDTCRLSDIPGVIAPVADGHLDQVNFYTDFMGTGKRVLVALGRTHLYEGHGPKPVVALAKAVSAANCQVAILVNANGCLRDWQLGDVVAIEDHANLTGISPFDGTYFFDTTSLWNPELTQVLAQECQQVGNYACLRGPEYQTRLETKLLANAGIDCVGMSTVMEAIMLHALGVKVCGMSVVSDLSFAAAPTDSQQVLESAARAERTVQTAIKRVLNRC